MSSIAELEAQKRKVHEVFSKADAALHKGSIMKEERDAILLHYYQTANEQLVIQDLDAQIADLRGEREPFNKIPVLIVTFALIMFSFFGVLFYSTGGITGAIVLEQNTTFTSNSSIPLDLQGVTRVNVSGVVIGSGDVTIRLLHEGNAYLIYERAAPRTAHASLTKSTYLVGEPVIYSAVNVSSAYLMTAAEAIPLDNDTITNLTEGSYTIKLIINDTDLTQEVLPFEVVTALPGDVAFNSCGELCNTNLTGNATLEITVADASAHIDEIMLAAAANSAPVLTSAIPDAAGIDSVSILLPFTDPDGDELLYESTHHDGMTETIANGTFTVGGPAGTYTYIVYASDLQEITPSNIFTITIEMQNATGNESAVNATPINTSQNVSSNIEVVVNVSNGTNVTATCDNPDPNRRPLECVQGNESTYFRPEDIFIENKAATLVGQLTPVGNLLIRGTIIEHSTGQPATNDYQLGYDDAGNFMPTVWIDSTTGDLHLRGTLTEANGNIPIQDGFSAMANKRGIVLALINRQTGDMVVRGNIIPYRRSFG